MTMHKALKFDKATRREHSEVVIGYADGSCPKNPGVGGWAYVILRPDSNIYQSGWDLAATNNTMEMEAVHSCLLAMRGNELHLKSCLVLSDSQYVIGGYSEWKKSWRAKNYTGVKNAHKWQPMHNLADEFFDLTFAWVRGHAGNYWNEWVDKQAGKAQKVGAEHLEKLKESGHYPPKIP